MNKIKRGDIVDVVFTHNDVFEGQMSPRIKCYLTKFPAGPGATFHFVTVDEEIPLQVNGNSENFVGIKFLKRPES